MHRAVRRTGCFICLLFLLGLWGCGQDRQEENVELKEAAIEEEEKPQEAEKQTEENTEKDIADQTEDIFVHVCGQVNSPGVYRLKSGSRVFEAIEAAGGVTEAAAEQSLNQAEKIEDGRQIYIPAVGEGVQPPGGDAAGAVEKDGRLNINTATREEFMTLSGIGEVKAAAIVQYREDHDHFQTIEELKEVEGIKDGTFNKIRDQIKVK